MPAGNWLLPEHHHRVQHLPLVAMFHAQHFKPSLAHDVGELLRLVQPESLPVAREWPQAGGGPEAGRPAPAALHHPRHFAQTGDQVRPIVQAVDGQHLVERPGAKRQFGYVAPLDRNARVQPLVADQAGRRLDHLAGGIDPPYPRPGAFAASVTSERPPPNPISKTASLGCGSSNSTAAFTSRVLDRFKMGPMNSAPNRPDGLPNWDRRRVSPYMPSLLFMIIGHCCLVC